MELPFGRKSPSDTQTSCQPAQEELRGKEHALPTSHRCCDQHHRRRMCMLAHTVAQVKMLRNVLVAARGELRPDRTFQQQSHANFTCVSLGAAHFPRALCPFSLEGCHHQQGCTKGPARHTWASCNRLPCGDGLSHVNLCQDAGAQSSLRVLMYIFTESPAVS